MHMLGRNASNTHTPSLSTQEIKPEQPAVQPPAVPPVAAAPPPVPPAAAAPPPQPQQGSVQQLGKEEPVTATERTAQAVEAAPPAGLGDVEMAEPTAHTHGDAA